LKYYKYGDKSAEAQADTYFQRYNTYKAKAIKSGREYDSFEEFVNKRQSNSANPHDPIYAGQYRLIPADQMQKAIKSLQQKIAAEELTRPEQVQRYRETLELLTDRIKLADGSESIPLSRADAEKIAELAIGGNFNPEDFGISTRDFISYHHIFEQSIKAGLTAASITVALKVAPELFKAIDYLFTNGNIDEDSFRKIGFAALDGASEGFIKGTLAASLTTTIKAGLLGETLKQASPHAIAAVTVLAFELMKNSVAVAQGKMSREELVDSFMRHSFTTTFALLLGSAANTPLPGFGYLIGSFIGSIVGTYAYGYTYQAYISFCVASGFTMFGVVDRKIAHG